MSISDLMGDMLILLNKKGIQASPITVAVSGSCYMEFKDVRMGKCRFGNHDERTRYGYRWQIRTGIKKIYESHGKGHRQFFFPATHLQEAVNRMEQYYNTINNK